MDAFSGYQQIKIEENSSKKTAFAGPRGRKYRYKVMPFGLVNAPTIYTVMIYDMKDNWDNEVLCTFKLIVDENNNTTIIINDVFSFVTSYENGLFLLEAIFTIARRHSLNWKLKKCDFFPQIVEFVGHDLTKEGNHPAGSKSTLLGSWPKPSTIRDISSFLGSRISTAATFYFLNNESANFVASSEKTTIHTNCKRASGPMQQTLNFTTSETPSCPSPSYSEYHDPSAAVSAQTTQKSEWAFGLPNQATTKNRWTQCMPKTPEAPASSN
jgi:hypothetical protein